MSARTLAGGLAALAAPRAASAGGDPARGAYLANIMHINGCHTPRGPEDAPRMEFFLAGGTIGFEIPGLGIFWPPNLTADAETGLGRWTDAEIVAAIRVALPAAGTNRGPARTGAAGRPLSPRAPW